MDSDLKAELERFKKERNEVFLSLDENRIRTHCKKWSNFEFPADPRIFWGSVHKAITGCADLPLEFRKASKAYLDSHNLKSLDDGDL